MWGEGWDEGKKFSLPKGIPFDDTQDKSTNVVDVKVGENALFCHS
jgi:hypothetical protein